ncbi:MAG TPA: hypothetical protein VMZ71_09720, partial [Gemmataceae bacterium]|nr:hypothetical protein [Gemmataceae bacterium]
MALKLERLERRDTPAFTSALAGQTAQLIGDNAADVFRISATGAFLQHNRLAVGDPGFASATDWDTNLAGTQTLAASSLSNVRFQTLGGGDDEVVLGTGSNPASNINAAVVILNSGPGADKVFIDMFGDTTGESYECTENGVQATGVNVLYGLGEVTTTLFLGSGIDTVNVVSTSADLDIRGNGGADRVNIGQPSLLTGIVWARNTGGAGNRTEIIIDDTRTTGPGGRVDFADDGAATEVRRGSIPFLRYIPAEVSSLDMFGSAGTDSYLYRTSSTVTTSLFGGGGDDDFQVALPGGAGGRLFLFGGDGADEIVVNRALPTGYVLVADGGLNAGL